jgi:outer membrane protein assembly factor BamB
MIAVAIVAILILIALLIGILLPDQSGRTRLRLNWRRASTAGMYAGMSTLLLIFAACGSSLTTSAPPPPPTITPLALTATGQPQSPPAIEAANSTDWTTYHHDNTRAGYVASTPDPQKLTQAWTMSLDGAVYAEPLVVGNSVIVATEGDSLYALNMTTGQVQWRTNVGTPVPQSSLPCGDINPLGITGTPVYDPATGLVFAVAEVTGPAHILVGVDVTSGQVKVRRVVDTDGMDPAAHQQRGALTLANGMVYINYGGLAGDCSDYIGRVVASSTSGQGPLLVYRVPTPREGGIWTPPGATVDSVGNLLVSVGNGAATGGAWDHSDSVLKLSPSLGLEDAFAPTTWPQENANDEDLGSQGPVLLPNGFVFIAGKSGKAYTLRATALGGVGGQVSVQSICVSFGGAAFVNTTVFVPCVDGLRAVTVGNQGQMQVDWHASASISNSPVVGGHTVYSFTNGTLYALSMNSGQVIASLGIGATNRFATPTLSGNLIFVGTNAGITAVTIG